MQRLQSSPSKSNHLFISKILPQNPYICIFYCVIWRDLWNPSPTLNDMHLTSGSYQFEPIMTSPAESESSASQSDREDDGTPATRWSCLVSHEWCVLIHQHKSMLPSLLSDKELPGDWRGDYRWPPRPWPICSTAFKAWVCRAGRSNRRWDAQQMIEYSL